MPFVSDSYRFIYFAAPATGSSVTLKRLLSAAIGEMIPPQSIFQSGKLVYSYKHGELPGLIEHGLVTNDQLGYAKVTGIRNPFSYYVNQYVRANRRLGQIEKPQSHFAPLNADERTKLRQSYKQIVHSTFKDYLLRKLTREGRPFMPWGRYIKNCDVFLRQENLESDFGVFRDLFGLPPSLIIGSELVNTVGPISKNYAEFYDDELIAAVYKFNAPFFKKFPEYRFGDQKPAG